MHRASLSLLAGVHFGGSDPRSGENLPLLGFEEAALGVLEISGFVFGKSSAETNKLVLVFFTNLEKSILIVDNDEIISLLLVINVLILQIRKRK